jgi:hypothetical protein
MPDHNFTASTLLPDGRSVYVSVDIPEGHAALADPHEAADHTEYAQIALASVLRNLAISDKRIARRAAENEASF